jgi:HEAT repeat protein
VRGVAAEALGEMTSSTAVPHLLAVLADSQADVRRAAAWALAQIGNKSFGAQTVLPGLFEALQSPDTPTREAGVMALGPIKHNDVPNALLWALGDGEASVREAAAEALSRLGKETMEILIEALDHEHAGVRASVALALAKIAKQYNKADAATPALIARLNDYDPDVRRIATEALGQIEDPDATAALTDRLWDDVPEIRRMAAWALGQIEDPEALPALMQALGDQVIDVQEAAVEALGKLEHLDAVPSLLEMLGHQNPTIRRACARALGLIGVKHPDRSSRDILVGLLHILSDPDPVARRIATRAMGEIGAKVGDDRLSGGISEKLMEALTDPDMEVRKNAASALGEIGHHAAVEGLTTLLRTPADQPVR